eukprot:300154_1
MEEVRQQYDKEITSKKDLLKQKDIEINERTQKHYAMEKKKLKQEYELKIENLNTTHKSEMEHLKEKHEQDKKITIYEFQHEQEDKAGDESYEVENPFDKMISYFTQQKELVLLVGA